MHLNNFLESVALRRRADGRSATVARAVAVC